MKINYI